MPKRKAPPTDEADKASRAVKSEAESDDHTEDVDPKEADAHKASPSNKAETTSPAKSEDGVGDTRRALSQDHEKAVSSRPPLKINRAPVLTLWAAVVAEKQGFHWDEAVTIGKYIAGVLAHSKGKSLGLYHDSPVTEEDREARRERDRNMGVEHVDAFGMSIPVRKKGRHHLAFSQGSTLAPASAKTYLSHAFKDHLEDVKDAMARLASAVPEAELGKACYPLYEHFRPAWKGWGQSAELDIDGICQLAHGGAWKEYAP
ncbi:hypothetical protein ACKKBF_B13825 [Auxenochlorella protothecoides x Auxenochlorella symbiontica]|uniref:Uncharacterized protein n=2 Tax=Auxenochlorella protothecoides TaxID=3075 RepID=A0A1D2ADW5_AUXPR